MHITRQICLNAYSHMKKRTAQVLRIIRKLRFCVQQAQSIKCVMDPEKKWENRERSNLVGVAYKHGRNVCTL